MPKFNITISDSIQKLEVFLKNSLSLEDTQYDDQKYKKLDTSSIFFKFQAFFVSKKVVINYLTMLLTKIEQGKDIASSIELLSDKVNSHYPKGKKNGLKRFYLNVLRIWNSDTQDPTLANVLSPYLSEIDIMILESAPTSQQGIRMIIDNYNSQSTNMTLILSAAASPVFYMSAIFAMINWMHPKVVVPQVRLVRNNGHELEGILLALNSFNESVLANQVVIIPTLISLGIFYLTTISRLKGTPRAVIELIPIFGIPFKSYRANSSVAFLQTLATLTKAGQSLDAVLSVMVKKASPFLSYEVKNIKETFELTGAISQSLNTNLFSVDTQFLLKVYLDAKDPSKHMVGISTEIKNHEGLKMKALAIGINVTGMVVLVMYLGLFIGGLFTVGEYLSK
ncbi:type II secretion system F family protein [Vibrio sp. R78045]|uniref:type II secretion system F family protein n=1 Tax=Vibrio sp. R78045 TaxID=3093868 RepID=UPI0036F324E4